ELPLPELQGQRGLLSDDAVPGAHRIEPLEDRSALLAQDLRERRIELLAGARLCIRCDTGETAQPVRDLRVLREAGDPRGDRDLRARESARPASAIPGLVGRPP